MMDPESITHYIASTFAGVDVVVASGDTFFAYNPGGEPLPDRWQPFATLVTSDVNDQCSDLERPGVFRLNIGVSRETFRALFGPDAGAEHDFTALDRIMPHPVYGTMFWLCVLNPSEATFQAVRPLLAEAYARAARRPRRSQPDNA
jgi:hypothetical protein